MPSSPANNLILIGAGVVAFIFIKKWADKQVKLAADKMISKDGDAGAARIIIAAMNPSGIDALKRVDGTNDDLIFSTAAQIKDLNKVTEYYKSQTSGGVLQDDLIKELGTDGYDKFLALATHGTSGAKKYSKTRTDIPANMWVVTKAQANVRKTAFVQSKYVPGNNIVKLVAAGKAVGISTGRYFYDEKGDTTFIEFYTLGSKTAGKQFFYIANSQVELLTQAQKTEREKTGKIRLEVLSGFSGVPDSHRQIAVGKRDTTLFNERFRAVGTLRKAVILGFPIMRLNTGHGVYVKVLTVQGKHRWVHANDIQIQNR